MNFRFFPNSAEFSACTLNFPTFFLYIWSNVKQDGDWCFEVHYKTVLSIIQSKK